MDKNKVMEKVLSPGQIGMELDNSMLMEELIPGLCASEMGELLLPKVRGREVD